jgi:hypothetical protein
MIKAEFCQKSVCPSQGPGGPNLSRRAVSPNLPKQYRSAPLAFDSCDSFLAWEVFSQMQRTTEQGRPFGHETGGYSLTEKVNVPSEHVQLFPRSSGNVCLQ